MAKFEFIALTLPGIADPAIAIAASRAGAVGVVDVSFVADAEMAVRAVARLARFGRGRCGVRLDPADEGVADAVISTLPPAVNVAILAPAGRELVRRQAELLRARDVEVLLEATSLDEARLAVDLGLDGVIAKGHEAGGRVGETTAFVLLQQLLSETALPVWAQGGIGGHSAAACAAAGAAGAVLDAQLALTRESPLPDGVKADIARMDGSETACVGQELGEQWRLYARPGHRAAEELRQLEGALATGGPGLHRQAAWREGLAGLVGWDSPDQAWLLGQDAAFAAGLATRFRTVGGVLTGLRQAVDEHRALAATLRPLAEGSPLAGAHGTRYPIVQGPMTRVSDVPGFAQKVAEAGALPFLALAMMRGPRVEELLQQTRRALGEQPWGVGILGFVPLELREEQLEVLRRCPPSFALIAGGRPDQALSLEREGIPTYLHVPSPGLLTLFTEAGARRFVFEGRECGGHVGPRTSFVLWNTMIDTLLASMPQGDLPDCHVLFAGGVHDARSAAMVAAMAAPLAERGAKVGVLLGTAYLFTAEAVAAGAITSGFQAEAVRCTGTVLLQSGPGHATRCADTAFPEAFRREQRRLAAETLPAEEIRTRLERLNLGRLRIASKGINRNPSHEQDPDAPEFVAMTPDEQAVHGMYMLGQVAALRDRVVTLAELHHDVCANSSALLDETVRRDRTTAPPQPCDIAIIGMSCLLPKAPSLEAYWQNILDRVDAIVEIPADRWDWRDYFDPDPDAPDRIYSRWGGFLDPVPFDPLRYGMPPTSLRSIEPLQLLTLEAVRAALDDAGYLDRPFARDKTGVILGASGVGDLANRYSIRSGLQTVPGPASQEFPDSLPVWTEDSFPGILPNVAAGRVANRFDLGGVNCTVDAACAASLAAVCLAVRELEAGTADMMIVGGADNTQNPLGYLCFSKTHALSPRGRCRPFDAGADGIAISEGLGVLVLKRLADAERDGDRIYAVIKGIGGSSGGRDKGLTAPRPEGQVLALERAYAQAGFSPATVGLVEAHGTGTPAGDRAEIQALTQVFGAAGAPRQGCAIGSVKSMIGHTKGAAGVAGLIKVALGLHNRVLPPTLHVERPNPTAGFDDSPFYVNSQTRPWLRAPAAPPRRAGVSAFGFGGTNFHVALEEYTGEYLPADRGAPVLAWPSELLCWTASSPDELRERLDALDHALAEVGPQPPLRKVAHTVWMENTCQLSSSPTYSELMFDNSLMQTDPQARLAIVATSVDDLRSKLSKARDTLAGPEVWDRGGVYRGATPLAGGGSIAFLYPGQGSQHPGMLADLAICFAEVREAFELADAVLADRLERPLSSYVFAPPAFSSRDERAQAQALRRTDRAQPALGAAEVGLSRLLAALGVRPAMVAGHSYGEYAALCGAGVIAEDVLYSLSEARGRAIIEAAERDLGTMAAVSEGPARVREALGGVPEVWVANLNAPAQTVISGTRPGIEQAIERLAAAGIDARVLPVACGFHSPLVAPARDRLTRALSSVALGSPRLPVYANTTAAPYPAEPSQIAELLTDHLVMPVRFAEQVEQMEAAGARLFVEVGPGGVLTGLVGKALGARPHLAVATQGAGHGLTALQHALAQLHAHGVDLDLDRLYQGRVTKPLRLDAPPEDPAPLPDTTWLIDGGSARPLREATSAGERPPARFQPPVASRPAQAAQTSAASSTRNGAHPEPTAPAPAPHAATADVVLAFQQLMRKFLDTQQAVVSAYLQSPGRNGSGASAWSETVLQPGAASTEDMPHPPAPPAVPPPIQADAEAAPSMADPERPGPPDVGQVTRRLVRLVAERTGYPPEMLDLDVDLEADLGIDSIKRVEILGAAQQELGGSDGVMDSDAMETLAKARTLRALVEALVAALSRRRIGQRATGAAALTPSASAELSRSLVVAVDAPIGETTRSLSGVVVITDDERGVARDLAALLRAGGIDVALVRDRQGHGLASEAGTDGYAARLGDPQAARDLVEAVHQRQGPIGALVHLLPLRAGPPFDELDVRGWQARLDLETRTLFHLAQAASADLRRAAPRPAGAPTRLLAAVCMDGAFATRGTGAPLHPSHGGVAGLVKTLAREWPEVACRVVDLGPDASTASWPRSAAPAAGPDASTASWPRSAAPAAGPDASTASWPRSAAPAAGPDFPAPAGGPTISRAAERLAAELTAGDDHVEVGWSDGSRTTLQLMPAPLPPGGGQPLLGMDSVLLVIGGARGITASAACEIARRYRPTILIAGRSPLPDPEEAADTAGIADPRALKAALAVRLRRAGPPATPAQVEPAYRRLLADRQMRANLLRMTEAGARVRYHQVDVRDAEQLTRLIDDAYARHGRIDGVIHGAGIVEDRLIEDKTSDSFDRVMATKTTGAFVLARALRPESLTFLALFSSISARCGNPGQGDYAAANEVLNKLAAWLDARWPCRVTSLLWGPWKGTGMVSDELERQLDRRGVQLIGPELGAAALIDELERGRKGDVEVILGAAGWQPATSVPRAEALPLLDGAGITATSDGIEVTRTLDPDRDLYLRDHRLDGHPVLPAAAAMELMAEAAIAARPGHEVTELRGLQVLKGVILDDGPRPVIIRTTTAAPPALDGGIALGVSIADPHTKRISYRAEAVLRAALTPAPQAPSRAARLLDPFPMEIEAAYDELLFQGPLLRGITRIEGIDDEGMVATLMPSSPQRCIVGVPPLARWIVDPALIDSGFQLAILWARTRLGMTPLPARIGRYRRFAALPDAPLRCDFRAVARAGGHILDTRFAFLDDEGRLLVTIEDMEFTCSRALNRLAVVAAGGDAP
ncbi:MAG: SDR family oxidoreductase [Egibacteraceae bacterium]